MKNLEDHSNKIDILIAEVRVDLRWMKWLLMAIVLESGIVIIQLATK